MREDNLKKVDWQIMRLPNLARELNEFLFQKKKLVIQHEVLLTKLNYSDTLESDIKRLIESSNGWLSNHRGWVRKKNKKISIMFASELCRHLYIY